jgi:hypothetical protein
MCRWKIRVRTHRGYGKGIARGRIASLSDKMSKEFRRLNASGKRYLQYRVDRARRRFGTYRDFLSTLERLRRTLGVKRKKRSAHRPRGSVKRRLVSTLVVELHLIARRHGGELTLGMNISANKPNGTLPAILKVFHEMLPAIVPLNIPYHTLQRMRRGAIEEPLKTWGGHEPRFTRSRRDYRGLHLTKSKKSFVAGLIGD